MAATPLGNVYETQARVIWAWLTSNGTTDPVTTPPVVVVAGGSSTIGTVNQGNAGTAAQAWFIQGQQADGAAAAGNPVGIAGWDGSVANRVRVEANNADGVSGARMSLNTMAENMVFNGTTWDRVRNLQGDAQAGTGFLAANIALFNGATFDRIRSGGATGSVMVAGAAAAGAALAGNPVLVAGSDAGGGGVTVPLTSAAGDAFAGSTVGWQARSFLQAFNGTTWDRVRTGSPTADPGNVGVLATQLHITAGANIQRVLSGQGDGGADSNFVPVQIRAFTGTGTNSNRLRDGVGLSDGSTGIGALGVSLVAFNGTTFDRLRTDGTTTGRLLIGGAGTAGTPAGGVVSIQGVTNGTAVPTTMAVIAAANVSDGFRSDTASTAAANLLTTAIPAGRVWVGTVSIVCSGQDAAAAATAGLAEGIISTTGAGVTPAAGSVLQCDAQWGANAATGAVGSQGNNTLVQRLVVIAPGGNTVQIQAASTITGTAGRVTFAAVGELQ